MNLMVFHEPKKLTNLVLQIGKLLLLISDKVDPLMGKYILTFNLLV